MLIKLFEIRDSGTFIPVMAIRFYNQTEVERFLIGKAGYGTTKENQSKYILLAPLAGLHRDKISYDNHSWPGDTRTIPVAHKYIIDYFEDLDSGAVVDVEYILGERSEPKISERLQ